MRFYIIAISVLYFGLWGYYSKWSLYEMLFYENNIYATSARLAVGFILLVGAIVALSENQTQDKRR